MNEELSLQELQVKAKVSYISLYQFCNGKVSLTYHFERDESPFNTKYRHVSGISVADALSNLRDILLEELEG